MMEGESDALRQRVGDAEPGGADKLFEICYAELHRLAEYNLRRAGSVTLGPTTLLHEAYLNVAGRDRVAFADRPGFLMYASRAMRGLIIDYARHRRAKKRGCQFEITLTEDKQALQSTDASQELAKLGDALDELAVLEPGLAQLVDLHFFCGFAFTEIAELRHVSDRTVQRDWRKARLLLQHAILDDEGAQP
jgi:RNA polymerase sigma factor (TIGR02999 family)